MNIEVALSPPAMTATVNPDLSQSNKARCMNQPHNVSQFGTTPRYQLLPASLPRFNFPKNDHNKQQTKQKHMQNITHQKMNRSCFLAFGHKLALAVVAGCLTFGPLGRADMVTDWNTTLVAAAIASASTDLPPVAARKAAIVQTAVFDAVNGIAPKYEHYFVTEQAPGGARQEAAAASAAYTTLVALYPAQKAMFDAQLVVSLASI